MILFLFPNDSTSFNYEFSRGGQKGEKSSLFLSFFSAALILVPHCCRISPSFPGAMLNDFWRQLNFSDWNWIISRPSWLQLDIFHLSLSIFIPLTLPNSCIRIKSWHKQQLLRLLSNLSLNFYLIRESKCFALSKSFGYAKLRKIGNQEER